MGYLKSSHWKRILQALSDTRPGERLRKTGQPIRRVTSVMRAGITDPVWMLAELLGAV
jgi:hypothetical protein